MAIDTGIFSRFMEPAKSVQDFDNERQTAEANKLNALIGRQTLGLNSLKMDEYKRGVERSNELRNLMTGVTNDEQRVNNLMGRGFLDEADKVRKTMIERRKAEAEASEKEWKVKSEKATALQQSAGWLRDNPTPANMVAWANNAKASGLLPPEAADEMIAKAKDMPPEEIARGATMMFQAGLKFAEQLPKLDITDAGTTKSVGMTSPVTGVRTQTGSIAVTPQPTKDMQDYEFAQKQGFKGSLDDFIKGHRKAGATNISNKTEVKLGESIANQVGPILKESREQALAGTRLVDSAHRIMDAAEKGDLYAGPLANVQLKAAQWGEKFGFTGKDTKEKIENTRNAIRGMAEQAVSARSQLGSQAQISNSEQELLNKATSGDIGDLTHGEVVQIAALNERMGRQMFARHGDQVKNVEGDPNTAGLAKFYKVPDIAPPRKKASAPAPAAGKPTLDSIFGPKK